MRLFELLNGVSVLAGKENLSIDVLQIFTDSRKKVLQGAFVAIKGERRNGNDYINQALENGAVVVITDDKEVFSRYNFAVLVENSRYALSFMWNNYYNAPTKNIKLVAVTGTNGKTSCAYYLYSILKSLGLKRGLISTIECLVNDEVIETNGGSEVVDICSAMTTPDPEILYSIFDKMRAQGVEYIVMEASSHALEQEKLAPICADYAIFTNLSAEHMDFHKNLEAYYQAKKKLFKKDTVAIINIDDFYGKRLSVEHQGAISCSIKENADFLAQEIELLEKGYRYKIKEKENLHTIEGKINGEFSVYNSLLSFACARKMGIDTKGIITGILSLESISGRFERIDNSNIYIDYAHTPYAMKNALLALRKIMPQGRIFALFGCGGDRDKTKRAMMGEIASREADACIITSDNSRSENPLGIIKDILCGVSGSCELVVIPNREKAILYAVSQLEKDDALILLGKGHECYEIDKNGKHYFNEREIVRRALKGDKNKML